MKTYRISVDYVSDVFEIKASSEDDAINKANKKLDENTEIPQVYDMAVSELGSG